MRSTHFVILSARRPYDQSSDTKVCRGDVARTGNTAPEGGDVEWIPPVLDCQAPFHLYTTALVKQRVALTGRDTTGPPSCAAPW